MFIGHIPGPYDKLADLDEEIARLGGELSRVSRDLKCAGLRLTRLKGRKTLTRWRIDCRDALGDSTARRIVLVATISSFFATLTLLLPAADAYWYFYTLAGFAFGAGVTSWFLLWPGDGALRKLIGELDGEETSLRREIEVLRERQSELEQQKRLLLEKRKRRNDKINWQSRPENWKLLRGTEFEEYIAAALNVLGYRCRRVGGSGDQGVDVIAEREGVRIAIQCKGWANNVDNSAVQEVHAARTITNVTTRL